MISVLLCNLCIVFGCTTQRSAWKTTKGLENKPVKCEALFEYKRSPIDVVTRLTESKKHYELVRVAFPSYFQDDPGNREVICWHYRQKSENPTGFIIVLPILGGDYGPSKIVAEYLANNGFDVLRFERKTVIFNSETGLAGTRKVFIRSIIDERRGIDWWLSQPGITQERLGIIGISMGGLQASILTGVDRRIKAGVIVLSGGDLPQLLMVTKERELVDFRNDLMRANGWNEEELFLEIEKQLSDIDPLQFASNIDPTNILQISARYDQTVPFKFAEKWYQAAGRPDRIILPAGHYSSVLHFPYILGQTRKHFEQAFSEGTIRQDSR